MNISSYTADQLVNLIENTILKQGYSVDEFTGGSVQITSTVTGVEKYKVHLFFGYDEKRNSVSSTIPIKAEHSDLWYTAIKAYVAISNSLKLGHDMDELNALMNTKKESGVKKKVEVEVEVEVIGKVGGYEVVGKVDEERTTSLRKLYEEDANPAITASVAVFTDKNLSKIKKTANKIYSDWYESESDNINDTDESKLIIEMVQRFMKHRVALEKMGTTKSMISTFVNKLINLENIDEAMNNMEAQGWLTVYDKKEGSN